MEKKEIQYAPKLIGDLLDIIHNAILVIDYHNNIIFANSRTAKMFNATEKQDVACYRIPAIVTASNGNLVAAIDERVPSCDDLRGSRDINIVI